MGGVFVEVETLQELQAAISEKTVMMIFLVRTQVLSLMHAAFNLSLAVETWLRLSNTNPTTSCLTAITVAWLVGLT
jgi:hypothetical protein